MKKLTDMHQGEEGIISAINGDTRYISRVTSIGITPGCRVKIVKNDKNRPIIVFTRDTMIALNSAESRNIEVEEVS
jgi:ferrous iron transport protein A